MDSFLWLVCVLTAQGSVGDLITCVCVCETDAVCVLFHISVWVWPSLTNECVLNRVTTCGGNVSGHGKTFTTL